MDCDRMRHDVCSSSVRVYVLVAFAPCKIHLMKVIISAGTPVSLHPCSEPSKDYGRSFLVCMTACLMIFEQR
jgi:hypothetical protein